MAKREETAAALSILFPCSSVSTEGNKTGAWRFLRPCYEEKTSPCSAACPAGEDIGRIELLTAQGLFKDAWETILRENPLPGVCGRVCFHPCEGACNRGEFDEAVKVHTIERFLADTAARRNFRPELPMLPLKSQKIAVIGAGPSGIAGAYFLTMLGYTCDVFEASPEPGGVLRWGIPLYRLPLYALNNDISRIQKQGVHIHTNRHISQDDLHDLGQRYDAIVMGCGHGTSAALGCPGDDLDTVSSGLKFLKHIREGNTPPVDGLSVVIGGGNTAVDVARSITRLGGNAIIAYRRRRKDMPAFPGEVEMLLDEGVELRELLAPMKVVPEDGECIVTLSRMKVEGEDEKGRAIIARDGDASEEIRARRVFTAIGEKASYPWYTPPGQGKGIAVLNNCVVAARPGTPVMVFAGDLSASVKSVVHAVASAKEAAIALDTCFRKGVGSVHQTLSECMVGTGPSCSMEIYMEGQRSARDAHIVTFEEINTDYFQLALGITQPRLLRHERLHTFEEVELKISASLAVKEAQRCFNCGLCNQCDNCYLYCPDMSVIHDQTTLGRHIDYDYCKGCGLCVVECPRNAMRLEEEIQ